MSAMYRLKAYFGMVPADEMDYVDEPDHYRGGHEHHAGPRGDRPVDSMLGPAGKRRLDIAKTVPADGHRHAGTG